MSAPPNSSPFPPPTASVVVPSLDEAQRLPACLKSIGRAPRVEVVVSDGGSTDGTLAILRRDFPTVRLVTGPAGRGGQLARGARATSGEILLFLHADCRLPGGWLPEVRSALADPRVALGCFRLHTEPASDDERGALGGLWWRLLDLRGLGLGLPYGDQALFTRRPTYERAGGFPDIPLMEDVVFVRGCLALGRLARLPLEVRTSARRFARRPVRARLASATFPLLFRLGVGAERLARWYGNVR